MGMVSAQLRMEPVDCIVTVVAGETGHVQVLEVLGQRTEVIRYHPRSTTFDYFGDVCGSLVFVGELSPGVCEVPAAVIYDLPSGRLKAAGSAIVRTLGNGYAEVLLTTESESGDTLQLRATCAGAALEAPLQEIS